MGTGKKPVPYLMESERRLGRCLQEGQRPFLIMAKINKIVEEGVRTDYTSVIVSYSNGLDSTGALYWALQEFPKEKIFLMYCDTGFEYPENIGMFYRTAAFIGVRPVLLQHPKGFQIGRAHV